MAVLVDTSVWSHAFRSKVRRRGVVTDELALLIREQQAEICGPVRQEVLSGISDPKRYDTLRSHLQGFIDLPIASADYEEAARCYNTCRSRGVQGTPVDMLLCSLSLRYGLSVFTTDKDFKHYARILGVSLHSAGAG